MRARLFWSLIVIWPSCAAAAGIDTTMSVVEAIEAVRAEGISVSYSSRLVEAGIRAVVPVLRSDQLDHVRAADAFREHAVVG